jgi:hypothetical protein
MKLQWTIVTPLSQMLAIVLFVGVFGLGFYLGRGYQAAIEPQIVIVATSTSPIATSTPVATTTKPLPTTGEVQLTAYITAYTYWDNTPPGSSEIAYPIIHQKAGGIGTYSDPITVAVGHSITSGVDTLDYKAGTRFYIPNLRKYFIVEDSCGDGETPQNGPCHIGYQGKPWLDLWIDGALGTASTTDACARAITELHMVIEKPLKNYVVSPGPVYGTACSKQFGDSLITI